MNLSDINHWHRCKPFIEDALRYANGTHTIEDIEVAIASKAMQFWPGQQSAVITEIHVYPRKKALHYFLAGGNLEELSRMRPFIELWAHQIQCTHITLAGRRGWLRTFLADEGYKEQWTVMSKELKS